MTIRNGRRGSRNRELLRARDGDNCQLCHELMDFDLPFTWRLSVTIDHKVPRAVGGTHALANLQLAHRRCNHRKGSTTTTLLSKRQTED